jgi:hypothetical protein
LADLRIDPDRLEYGGVAAWSSLARHEAYWPQAALAKVEPVLAAAAVSVAEGQVTADQFSSGAALGLLTITPDLGVGLAAVNCRSRLSLLVQKPIKLSGFNGQPESRFSQLSNVLFYIVERASKMSLMSRHL